MELLKIEGAGLLTWSKSKKNNCLFATTSIYDSFNPTSANDEESTLQIHSFDLMNKTSSSRKTILPFIMILDKIGIAKIKGTYFSSIDWEAYGENDKHPYGLIATGFADGNVGIWDVNTIISARTPENHPDIYEKGLVSIQTVHDSAVNSIAFNPFKQHLIASAGTEVVIHNIERNIVDPEVFSPGANQHQGLITDVSWNHKVPHILASASQNGTSVVWDLKVNKAIFNFSDNNKTNTNRHVSLSWNPEIATQIGVVYDDERCPELQIWDLRNPMGPVFATSNKGHSKGIHSMDWCLTDPSLIVTMGRDNRVCFWNYKSDENDHLVSEKPMNEPCIQIKCSPRLPAIYSVTTASGNSSIFSFSEDSQLDTQLSSYAPRWLKPPVGARFSFDGKLAVFSEKQGIISEFKVQNIDERMQPIVEDFEQNFESQKVDLGRLCQSRLNSEYLDDQDKYEWKFIQSLIHEDVEEIISVLGLEKSKIIKKTETFTGKVHSTSQSTKKKTVEDQILSEKQAEDFFNRLATQDPRAIHLDDKDSKIDNQYMVAETIQKNTNWNTGVEKIIKDNILVGNIEGAVDSALKNGRIAEALLLSYFNGPELFKTAMNQYFTACNEPFVKGVIRHLVEGKIEDIVKTYSLESWKECVALCLSYTGLHSKVFQSHMEDLANRFVKEKNDHDSALLCYILSKNFPRILDNLAFRTERYIKGSIEYNVYLMRTVEKLTALRMLTHQTKNHAIVDRFIYSVAKILHIFNGDRAILNLLTIHDCKSFECIVIKDRILPEFGFPFRNENVGLKTKKKVEPVASKKLPSSFPTPGGVTNLDKSKPLVAEIKPPIGLKEQFSEDKRSMPKPNMGSFPQPRGNLPFNNEPNNPPTKSAPPLGNLSKPTVEKKDFIPPPTKFTSPTTYSSERSIESQPKGQISPPPTKELATAFVPSTNLIRTSQTEDQFNKTSTQIEKADSSKVNPYELAPTLSGSSNIKTLAPNTLKTPNYPKPNISTPPTNLSNPVAQTSQSNNAPPMKMMSIPPTSGINKPPSGIGQPLSMNQVKPPPKMTPGPSQSSNGIISETEIPPHAKPIYESLLRGMQILEQIDVFLLISIMYHQKNPMKKIDTEKKMNVLFTMLANDSMKEETFNSLIKLCEGLDNDNLEQARFYQEKITKEDWESNKEWLNSARRIVLRK